MKFKHERKPKLKDSRTISKFMWFPKTLWLPNSSEKVTICSKEHLFFKSIWERMDFLMPLVMMVILRGKTNIGLALANLVRTLNI